MVTPIKGAIPRSRRPLLSRRFHGIGARFSSSCGAFVRSSCCPFKKIFGDYTLGDPCFLKKASVVFDFH